MTASQTSTAASGATPPRRELTVASITAAVLVAAIMGVSYPYMVLKLGFGPNVSVVAAFFGFVILNVISYRTYDRYQNNIVQTAGTSAAQTAFMCVLLGAFDMLREANPNFAIELSVLDSFLWLTVACTLGVLLAVPLRRHFIVDEKLPFADGVAVAETLVVLDPPRGAGADQALVRAARDAAKAMGVGLLLSAVLMFIRDDAQLIKWVREGLNHVPTLGADHLRVAATAAGVAIVFPFGVGISYSLLSIGSGMLISFRVNVSMMIGGTLAYVVAPWWLVEQGYISGVPTRTEVLFWVMWPATGMLVAGGLTALALRWRLLVDTFRSLRTARIGTTEFPLSWVLGGIALFSALLCIVQRVTLGMPIWMTLLAIILSIPLMLVGIRVLGETNWGPISALSNMMQGVFAAVAPGNVAANMAASGTTGTIATSSEAIMQDYKAGEVLGSTPRSLTIAQLLAVPVGAAAVALAYPALVDTYGITGEGAKLSSPISRKWAGFANILEKGVDALPSSALWALLIFSVLGIVLTVLESNPKLKPFTPSPTGIGIGILVPFSVISTMFLGAVVGLVWKRARPKAHEKYMIPLASGFIAGEALVAVAVPLLLWAGLGG